MGYTEISGAGIFDNQKLSAARSAAVAQYLRIALANNNVSITTSVKAEKAPVASNSDLIGQALNRRVEIQVK